MKRKEQYADEIIEMLERTKCGAWASNINLNTKDRVIEVCQNVVDSWSGRKFKDHCTTSPQALEQTSWIPVSEKLPEVCQRVLVTSYGRVCYAMMIGADWNSGYPIFKLQDSLNEKVVCETTVHSEFTTSRIIAWMPLPEPYKEESEVQNEDSN